ncbi:hypothetical protein AAJCM20276_03030 [Acetobacter aceti]|uniref:Uncharacterized protein n=1 Tax=Acetobacter aceti TaxID=435 RepID=A0A6S6PEC1_ACEAC|nr:hypothetical protein AAJCM20276_03030 [Acetobacter aceti]
MDVRWVPSVISEIDCELPMEQRLLLPKKSDRCFFECRSAADAAFLPLATVAVSTIEDPENGSADKTEVQSDVEQEPGMEAFKVGADLHRLA